ncbi:hypothetical protein SORBI_3009G078000 [Sorghum bicolor]|uniref:Uncharacterized protein n=1 Tax=Sorghum bicolor TaxID=4558 RepID=A0A1B6P7B4_SORBI|nr:hypothetical protein SORBI_3009G078000 [Sorghum bicolor]
MMLTGGGAIWPAPHPTRRPTASANARCASFVLVRDSGRMTWRAARARRTRQTSCPPWRRSPRTPGTGTAPCPAPPRRTPQRPRRSRRARRLVPFPSFLLRQIRQQAVVVSTRRRLINRD